MAECTDWFATLTGVPAPEWFALLLLPAFVIVEVVVGGALGGVMFANKASTLLCGDVAAPLACPTLPPWPWLRIEAAGE